LVDGGELPVIDGGEEDADDVHQRTAKSRVWPTCSFSSWNGADGSLELRRMDISFCWG
jgi:hypothetical protein